MRRIKVAYILTPITYGGAEKVSLNFLDQVNRSKFEIQPILLVRPWEDDLLFAREMKRLNYDCIEIPVAKRKIGDFIRIPRVFAFLYSILKRGEFDLVHTHGYFADICGLPIARALGINCVSTCHGFIANDYKLKMYIKVEKFALKFCRNVIAVSEKICCELIQSGICNHRITVIPNAVKSSDQENHRNLYRSLKRQILKVDDVDLLIGYTGRLSPEKGLSYLLDAFAMFRRTGRLCKLVIIGEGPERNALERRAIETGLGNETRFAGFQSDIEDWYPALDVLVLPSLTEGTPLTLLEAMAAEVPVIASAVGGVPNVVIDGVNGLLVSPRDSKGIVEKLCLLSENQKLARRLGREGAATIRENHGIEKWCRSIENCYIFASATMKPI